MFYVRPPENVIKKVMVKMFFIIDGKHGYGNRADNSIALRKYVFIYNFLYHFKSLSNFLLFLVLQFNGIHLCLHEINSTPMHIFIISTFTFHT